MDESYNTHPKTSIGHLFSLLLIIFFVFATGTYLYLRVFTATPGNAAVSYNIDNETYPIAEPTSGIINSSFTNSAVILSDEKLTELAIGKWQSNYYGTRMLELKPDGTAIMHYTPEGMATLLVGPHPVTVNINWKVSQGSSVFTLLEGSPQNEVDAMINLYGKTQTQKIISQDGKNFTLLDKDGVTLYEWHKIED